MLGIDLYKKNAFINHHNLAVTLPNDKLTEATASFTSNWRKSDSVPDHLVVFSFNKNELK